MAVLTAAARCSRPLASSSPWRGESSGSGYARMEKVVYEQMVVSKERGERKQKKQENEYL